MSIVFRSFVSVFGGEYTGQTGSIVSSSYPSLYHNNLDLEWTITTDLGMRLRLIFEYFEVESGPRCMSDYLLVSDLIINLII